MLFRQYGTNGPAVSALGFGAMRLPARKKGDWGSVNFTRSVAVIRQAMAAGVNFFDSHHNYHNGLSELAIGKALKGWKGPRPIVIQTKTPYYRQEKQAFFQQLIEQALAKTGVNCLDYLFFHSMDMKMFKQRGRGFLKLTDWAMKKGYIRRRGFSSHDTAENIKAFVDTGEFSAMLVSYNYLNPAVAEAIAYAAQHGMGVSVMNPVGGGSLAADAKQILSLLPGAKSAAEVALRYVLGTSGVVVAVSGMNESAQIKENVAIASSERWMSAAQRRTMQARLGAIQKQAMAICTSCGYCMPCPAGVNIPENFLLLNRARLFGLTEFARERFARLAKHRDGDRSAKACRQCGKCLPKCPSKVPIIRQLQEAAEMLGK